MINKYKLNISYNKKLVLFFYSFNLYKQIINNYFSRNNLDTFYYSNVSRGTLSYKFTKILIINISKLFISPCLELLNYFPGNKLDTFL